ncbi:MAG: ribosomal protein S18-alanine N-acetyltransferase [Bacilli bacterium]|nr:ribosomal protein S18-alanine N-acetyltransferase [Bacilli bacterium]MDD4077133.1 ribosomal protein S18-alanine N-acetyltransferase [Bacilli bacterium]MDD4388039.1 ribosomal protein S18-alanine N-acetyltransferase [Bacilli bacterium]
MKYCIRPLVERDIINIVRGEEEIFGSTLGYDLIYSELKLNPYAHYLVVEIDGHFGGYIGLWIYENNAEIINFFIIEKYQGLGFGKLLLKFAVELCEMSHIQSISLEVREDNQKAINLYNKFDFVFSHYRKNYYNDSTDALVLIKKMR